MEKKVTAAYIHHSGFYVSIADKLFIFDFYSDRKTDQQREQNIQFISDAIHEDSVEKVYIFASHAHGDHFDTDIFALNNIGKKTRYILSSDIAIDNPRENYYFIDAYQTMAIDDIVIQSYGSTDEGVSFLVRTDNKTIFHAGDLNWWYWYDESTAEELAEYERSYKAVIHKLQADLADLETSIDLAFFPVDPRLNEYGHFGGEYFIRRLKPTYFFPMHFWGNFNFTKVFADHAAGCATETNLLTIDQERQVFELIL